MLSLPTLRNVLASVTSPPRLHTAILFTPSGNIIAQATNNSKDNIRILVGVASEIWLEVGSQGIGMVEGELGKIIVLPLYRNSRTSGPARTGRSHFRSTSTSMPANGPNEPPLLVALNATDEVDWAELQIKARGIVSHLAEPLAAFGDRLLPPPPPPDQHFPSQFY
ncbi:hypothetical protein BU17DRAFT_98142 [Hysterangium stoloniferum]|nr:hypothetical protein BU17DRAFT_98142 [Hysterangium stoloniferum]